MKSVIITAFAFLISLSATSQDALTIVKKLDATLSKVEDKSVKVTMTMTNMKSNKNKVKEAELLQKGKDMKLFRYTAPESDAGIATLALPNKEIYLYLPMFKNPKKITNLAESNTFNKSDFSISDMSTSGYAIDYTPELLSSENGNYRVQLIPKFEKPTYAKLIIEINKTGFYQDKIEYYDKKMEMVKFATYHHIKVDGVWVADNVSMEDVKKQHKTTLEMSEFSINKGLSDDLFTLENLVPKKE